MAAFKLSATLLAALTERMSFCPARIFGTLRSLKHLGTVCMVSATSSKPCGRSSVLHSRPAAPSLLHPVSSRSVCRSFASAACPSAVSAPWPLSGGEKRNPSQRPSCPPLHRHPYHRPRQAVGDQAPIAAGQHLVFGFRVTGV